MEQDLAASMPKWQALKPEHLDPAVLSKWGDILFPENNKKKTN